jgi:hypothetical protein
MYPVPVASCKLTHNDSSTETGLSNLIKLTGPTGSTRLLGYLFDNDRPEIVQHKTQIHNFVHKWQVTDGEFVPENLEPLLHNANKVLHSHPPRAAPEIATPLDGTERALLAVANDA